jgi:hypothetical protein
MKDAMKRIVFLCFLGLAAFAESLDGEWKFSMMGPMGEVPATMALKVDGKTVTGTFDFSGRKLTIENGTFEDGTLKMTVKRDRPQGGTAVYELTGKLSGDKIEGRTVTSFMGSESNAPWSAARKK